MPDRKKIASAYRNAQAARRAVTTALRRPRTYRSAAKELLWTSVNLAMYPAGVLTEHVQPDGATGHDGRFDPSLPLHYLDPDAANTPIIMLHGYFHNRSAFLIFRRSLKRAGFRNVTTVNYNVIGHDVMEMARMVGHHVDATLEESGAAKVHLIGHSLGGLVARAYIQLGGGEDKVGTCITLGSPHSGTYAAWAGRGKAARDLRPGSALIRKLNRSSTLQVRFVSYYSNLDAMIIPASSAKIVTPGLNVRNVLMKDVGHMSFLISQQLIRSIVDALWRPDQDDDATVTSITKKRKPKNQTA